MAEAPSRDAALHRRGGGGDRDWDRGRCPAAPIAEDAPEADAAAARLHADADAPRPDGGGGAKEPRAEGLQGRRGAGGQGHQLDPANPEAAQVRDRAQQDARGPGRRRQRGAGRRAGGGHRQGVGARSPRCSRSTPTTRWPRSSPRSSTAASRRRPTGRARRCGRRPARRREPGPAWPIPLPPCRWAGKPRSMFQKSQFMAATQRFLESRDGYERRPAARPRSGGRRPAGRARRPVTMPPRTHSADRSAPAHHDHAADHPGAPPCPATTPPATPPVAAKSPRCAR